tara:strand:+ start:912 stop:1271 length:360 start_codon:yes stop_codon:yes gene_type:complete
MGKNGEIVAYFLALIFLLGMVGPVLNSTPSGTIANPFSCKAIEGTIIHKEHDEDGHKLYVELFIKDEWEGHIIYVSNKTYQTYEVGYSYEQIVCELIEYENMLDTYEDMLEVGILEKQD